LNDAVAISTILDATKSNARVAWLHEGHVIEGVARHLVRDPENAYFLGDEDDVRDAYLRVSSTFEHFLPVRDVMRMIPLGEFGLVPVALR
jgi:hypothetical protein